MSVVPYDESNISSNDTIIRRINPDQHTVWDDNKQCMRISTKAYSPSSGENGGMSVDIEDLISKDGKEPKNYVTTPVFTGAVAFRAGDLRDSGLIVGYDPLPTNPYHGEVWGNLSRPNRFTNAQKKDIQNASRWYVELKGIQLK